MNKICLVVVLCLVSASLLADAFVKNGGPENLSGSPVAVMEAGVSAAGPGKMVRDPEASGGKALFFRVEDTPRDTLLFGQYAELSPGKYIALFRLKIDKDYSYPEDYPAPGTEVTVTGVFDTYMEGEYMRFCQLIDATMTY